MKKIIDCLKEKMTEGFVATGYDEKYAMVSVSNRPDLCQYQCNGAMAAAKEYKKAPIQIANDVVEKLSEDAAFEKIEAVNPGFINIIVSGKCRTDGQGRAFWRGNSRKTENDCH